MDEEEDEQQQQHEDNQSRRVSFEQSKDVNLRDPENNEAEPEVDGLENDEESETEDSVEIDVPEKEAAMIKKVEIPHFPVSLTFTFSIRQEIPSHVYEKLKYQFVLITNLLRSLSKRTESSTVHSSSTLLIIHQLSKAMKKSIIDEQILFPKDFLQQFCSHCDCMQLVGVTAIMRMRKRSMYSRVNRKSKQKLKNEIVRRVLLASFYYNINFLVFFFSFCLFSFLLVV
jgi:RNase P subunit RPR2